VVELLIRGYGVAKGCFADFVVLQAADPIEAIRLRAPWLQVYRRGRCVAHSPANTASLNLAGRPSQVSYQL
jgi:cytosine/creatinine deaminase